MPTYPGLPHLVRSAFRFFQPLSDLLLLDAYELCFTLDPLVGFYPLAFFPFKDSDIFQYRGCRHSFSLNSQFLENWLRLLFPEGTKEVVAFTVLHPLKVRLLILAIKLWSVSIHFWASAL
jgi:hypothetical protein